MLLFSFLSPSSIERAPLGWISATTGQKRKLQIQVKLYNSMNYTGGNSPPPSGERPEYQPLAEEGKDRMILLK